MGKIDIFASARIETENLTELVAIEVEGCFSAADSDEMDEILEKKDVVLSPYELEYERRIAAAYTLMEKGNIEGYEIAMQKLKEWEQSKFDSYELEFAYNHEVSVSEWITGVKKKDKKAQEL